MNSYAKFLLALVACAYVVQVRAGVFDSIEDAVGFGRDDRDDNKKDKDEHEDTYEGGFGKQVMHSVADAAFDRLEGMAKDKFDNPLVKPMLDMASGNIKERIHHRINDFGESEEEKEELVE